MLQLLRFSSINWWRVGAVSGVAGIVALFLYVWQQNIALGRDRAVYQNPRTVLVVRRIRVEGPVRIVTRTVRVPNREEITTEETRGPILETAGTGLLSEPVFPPAPRTDRWLFGFGAEPFHAHEQGWLAFHAGYSFRNRLDLRLGLDHRKRSEVGVTLRF